MTPPAFITNAPASMIVDLDVRDDIARGDDPFKKIMGAVQQLKAGEILRLINVFEPVPLYGVLGKRGLAHWTERVGEVWHIYFYPAESAADPETPVANTPNDTPERTMTLDVSGLEPPEPMMKILATLPAVDAHTVLVIEHHREPLMLYDKLTERGYVWTTTKRSENSFHIEIRLKPGA